jgi:hypothetical protein
MFDPCMVSLSNHQPSRSNVLAKYASAQPVLSQPKDRFFAPLNLFEQPANNFSAAC